MKKLEGEGSLVAQHRSPTIIRPREIPSRTVTKSSKLSILGVKEVDRGKEGRGEGHQRSARRGTRDETIERGSSASASAFVRKLRLVRLEGELTKKRSLLKTEKRRKRGDLDLGVSRRVLLEFRSTEAAGRAADSTAVVAVEAGSRWAAGIDRT